VRQQEVLTIRGRYFLDVAYPHVRLGVEYDGRQHMTPLERIKDEQRTRALATVGWQLLRFSSVDLRHPGQVRADICETIAVRARDLGFAVD
jgi:very-short-patch-repair endonuclease